MSGSETPRRTPRGDAPAARFVPPPYPYHRLRTLSSIAERHPGGVVDLSVGTPCDPPPRAALDALAAATTARGYPASKGSSALRGAAADWLQRRFGVAVDPDDVAACMGTKELVASVAGHLHLRTPARDTVLVPEVAYPTYAMGARLAGLRCVGVPEAPDGGPDLAAVGADDAARAVCVWINSPSNPTGALADLESCVAWGRAHGVPVLVDECYTEFTWAGPPATALTHGFEGVVSLHSLSKRSNMAGLRVGFYTGDPSLVSYLAELRQHAGCMVAGPVQEAAAVALADDAHVARQRHLYRRRLEILADALQHAGLEVELPAGGFYLWVPVPGWAQAGDGRGDWVLAEALAAAAGVLVSPGEFYGERSAGHVRMAVVQPDERLELVARRLAVSRPRDVATGSGPRTPGR